MARVAEIRYGKLAEAERELQQAQKRLAEVQKNGRMLKEEVDEEDIAALVSKWTGIPVGRLLEGEAKKLVTMEDRLRQRVVGQEDALERVSNAIRRNRAGPLRSESSHRLLHFPRPHGRGQDGTGSCPRRIFV